MKINFKTSVIILLFHLSIIYPYTQAESCNELVCGSIVSKCLLTQSCQCKLSDCFCCKDCLHCLGDLFSECCNCLDMCPEHNDTLTTSLIPKSQVSDFDGIPELFDTLTSDYEDDKWQTYQFPIDLNQLNDGDSFPIQLLNDIDLLSLKLQENHNKLPEILLNCTVIFLNNCITNTKCWEYCESMGANSYRWFYDGCCECVGSTCINYGLNENRCSRCPDDYNEDDLDDENLNEFYDSLEEDYDNDDKWDYGEDD